MFDFLRRHQVPISSGILWLLAAMLISANVRGERRADPLTRIVLEAVDRHWDDAVYESVLALEEEERLLI